jgi:translation initiation factor 4E binding protein 1
MSTAYQQNSPTKAKNIQIRRVLLSDPSQMPSDLSTTPGGTLFSTTPGGTRIVYDRAFLLECRNSPLAKSPPVGLPLIPGVTCQTSTVSPSQQQHGSAKNHHHIHHHPQPHVPSKQIHDATHGQGHVATTNAVAGESAQAKKVEAQHEDLFEMDM